MKKTPWLKPKTIFVEIESETLIIKEIFRLAATGKGVATIDDCINPPEGVTKWTYSKIEKILKNPLVCGDKKRGYPVIISETLFNEVKEERNRHIGGNVGLGNKGGVSNIFSGRVKCAACGKSPKLRQADTLVKFSEFRTESYLACTPRQNKCVSRCDCYSLEIAVLMMLRRWYDIHNVKPIMFAKIAPKNTVEQQEAFIAHVIENPDDSNLRMFIQRKMLRLIDKIEVSNTTAVVHHGGRVDKVKL